jgi:uncharacterized protein (DUF342 family)
MTNIDINILPPVDAEAFITVSHDGLEASLKIKPPENGGKDLAFPMLKIFAAKNRVIFGVDDGILKSLGEKPVYNTEFIIARGIHKENGTHAELVYHVETHRQIKPKERADGTVDFKDLGLIQEIKKGQLLCEKIPASPGKPGTDVRGVALAAVDGKDIALPEGKNTVVSEDKLKLFSALDGQVTFAGGKINILNTFTVEGNVSVETGNIDFNGNVVVRGDVAHGYTIKAAGDVTVEGVVESAKLTVSGDLVIKGGFLGSDGGELEVAGSAFCRFIEGGQAIVKGNLDTTYIMNARVICGGTVNLSGKGLVRGGYLSARTCITANFLGSPQASSGNTVIEIGKDPFLIAQYEQLTKEAEEQEANIANLEAVVVPMTKAKQSGILTFEKVKQLEQAVALLENLKPAYISLKETLENIEAVIESLGRGTVNVQKTAYTGLKIVIGQETLILQKDHDYVTFYNGADGITFVPLTNK